MEQMLRLLAITSSGRPQLSLRLTALLMTVTVGQARLWKIAGQSLLLLVLRKLLQWMLNSQQRLRANLLTRRYDVQRTCSVLNQYTPSLILFCYCLSS